MHVQVSKMKDKQGCFSDSSRGSFREEASKLSQSCGKLCTIIHEGKINSFKGKHSPWIER